MFTRGGRRSSGVTGVGLLVGFLLLTLLGVLAGCLTGLSPGLHVNNVAALVLAMRGAWAGLVSALFPGASSDSASSGLLISCFLLATAASHAVFDFIPSVFLGAPTEDTALATLPGHRLLLVGQGAKAVALAARGALLGTALAAVAVFPLRFLLSDPIDLAERFRPWTAPFLVFVLGAIVVSDLRWTNRMRRAARAVWVQLLAAILGIAVLRGPPLVEPAAVLFPLFSGLFGIPNLLVGLRGRAGRIPRQRLEPIRGISFGDGWSALRGTLAGASVSWLPGLSGGAAATLASIGTRRRVGPGQFMVVLGAVSTSTAVLSVAVLFMIHRARSGAAAAIRTLIGDLPAWSDPWSTPGSLVALILAAVLATAIAAPLAARLSLQVAARWSRFNTRRLSAISLLAVLALIGLVTGPVGLAVTGLASLVGLVPVALGVRRIHLMASLLVPVLLSSLGSSS